MSLIKCMVTIPNANGLPEDGVTNTWYAGTDGTDDNRDEAAFRVALINFYAGDGGAGATHRVTNYLSTYLNGSAITFKTYRLNDPTPRVVLGQNTSDCGNGAAGTSLPNEVAAVFSYHSGVVSGANRARRRGRIYLGPLQASAMAATTSGGPGLSTAFITAVQEAAVRLAAASLADTHWSWVTYSPTDGLADGVHAVRGCWMDNTFDTQRRRGVRANARNALDLNTTTVPLSLAS